MARKGVKWYRKLAEVFLDFSVYNSYIIWKNLNPEEIRKKPTSHLEYRQDLIKAIITHHVHGDATSYRRGLTSGVHQNPLRLKEKHFISPIATMPGKYAKRRECVRCNVMKKRKDSTYECRQCDGAFCLFPCFEIYHTRLYYDRDIDNDSGSEFISSSEEEVLQD